MAGTVEGMPRRPKAPELRQGNSNVHALNDKRKQPLAKPVGFVPPPSPVVFRSDGADRATIKAREQLWAEIWEAGAAFYSTETDYHAVERYVTGSIRRRAMLAELAKAGWVTEGSQGQLAQHPLARMLRTLEAELGKLEDRLGLNPEARLRLGLASKTTKSALGEFVTGSG